MKEHRRRLSGWWPGVAGLLGAWKRPALASAMIALSMLGCVPPERSSAIGGMETRPAVGLKRVAVAILGDPQTLSQTINSAGTGPVRGVDEVEKLIAAGAAILDDQGVLRPQLAEAVPAVENGLWAVLPDGRMRTTWQIKEAARWHDGTPVTAEDLVFTLQLGQDRELAVLGRREYRWVEGVEATDPRTVRVTWTQPYIKADQMFTHEFALPLPKHILGRAYLDDKPTLLEHPYWTREFVGTGPFRLRAFVLNSHMTLEAAEQYVLGRPRIDEIEVKFVPDPNVLVANILAGAVDLSLGRGLSFEQTVQVERQWSAGRMEAKAGSWIALYPQLQNPDPPALAEVRFRRALLHAVDRQQIADALQAKRALVAHTELLPAHDHKEVEKSIVTYAYDPERARQLIQSFGYAPRADGKLYDAAGQSLVIEARTSAGDDLRAKITMAVTDYWRQLGIDAKPYIVPDQLAHDGEYRAQRPAFELVRQPFDPGRYHSSDIPTAEKRWRGNNRTGYASPELDALLDQYFLTVPRPERMQLLGRVVHHLTDNLVSMGILYSLEAMLISNRLVNVAPTSADQADETWNAHLWDVR